MRAVVVGVLMLPAVSLGVFYWISVGWLDDGYDIGHATRIAITGVYALLFVAAWAFVVGLGFLVATWRRADRLHPKDAELALGNRRVQRR